MRLTKQSKRLIISAFFVVLLLVASTFAWIRIGYNATSNNKLVAGTLNMTLDESTSEGIRLEKAIPIPYREGIKTTEYTFSLENTGAYTTGYKISFENENSFEDDNGNTITITDQNRIADQYIRYLLVKNGEEKEEENSKLISETTNRVIDTGILAATEKNEYTLQVWIDYDAGDNGTTNEVMNRYFNVKLKIDAIQADGTSNDGQSHKKYTLVLNGNGGLDKKVIRNEKTTVGELPETTREGYTFTGWYTAATNGEQITAQTPITAEKMTFYAHWNINQYQITFDGNGGTDGTSITDDYNKALGALPETTRAGYTFTGWYTQRSGGEQITAQTTIPARNTTYYAHWDANEYRISFDGNGGTDGEDIVGDCDTELGNLPTSTRRGYVFEGWFTESEGGTQINEHTLIPAGDTTYYAHWIVDYFDVTYDYATNGGETTTKESDVVINQEDIDLTPTATKEGFEFVGWNTNQNATTGLETLKMGRSAVTLYAIYKKQATATFNANGATLSANAVSCYIYNNGTSCTATTAPTITREEYTVKGYATSATATDKEVDAPTPGESFSIGLNGATYYAITLQVQNASIYYYNGTSQAITNVSCTKYNTDTKCIYNLPTTVTESTGTNETEYVGLSKTKSSRVIEQEINSNNSKYYAVYEKDITATFYYYDNGLASTTASAKRILTTDESEYTIEYQSLTIPNEVLLSTGPNGANYTGVSKDTNSQNSTNVTTQYKKYHAYYNGVWTATYSKDDSTVTAIGKTSDSCDNYASTDEAVYTTTGISCGKTLPSITAKRGYTADGWYEETTKIGNSEGSYTITKDVSLVGKATINQYTVTYNATTNGGTTTATTDTVDFGSSIDLTPTATKEGYDFLGWNTDSTASSGLSSLIMDTDNVILFAIFKKSTSISLEPIPPTEYTGSQIVANQAVLVDGSNSQTITYTYYTDSACTNKTLTSSGSASSGGAPIDVLYDSDNEVIPYYVQASVPKIDGSTPETSYKAAKSNCVPHRIIPKEVSVVWGETTIFDYNGHQQAPTASMTSVISGETLNVTRTQQINAGAYTSTATVTVTGGREEIKNYSVTNSQKEYRINPINNTLTLSADQHVAYGTSSTTFTIEENVSGGTLSVVDDNETATASISGNTVTISNLGAINANTVVKVTVTSGATTNYNSATATYNLTIDPRTLTVTAQAKSKTYGEANPSLTYTYSGNVSGETPAFTGSLTTSATETSNKGTYDITQGTLALANQTGFTASNYTLSYKKASLTVNARATTCTAESKNVTYPGSAVTGPNGSCTNLVSGHTPVFTNTGSQNGVGTTTNTLTSVVIENGSGTDVSSNYTITKVNGTITVTGITRTATFNPNSNTLSTPSGCSKNASTGVVTCSCTTTGTNTSCSITSPTITAHANTPSICGYSESATGVKTGCSTHNSSTSLSSNSTYYAQTYGDKSGTFTIQDTNAATKSGGSTSCTAYNGAGSCSITSPTLAASSGYTSLGWKKDGTTSSTSADVGNSSTSISITGNVTYKSVTYKPYSATFTLKDTNAATASATSASCNAYNGATSCSVTAPTLTAKSGYTAVGWSATNGGTTAATSFTSGNTYYSITYNNTPITITFYKNGASTQTNASGTAVSDNTVTRRCYKYNASTTCSITSPTIVAATNFSVIGYNTSSSGTSSSWSHNTAKTDISANASYYAVTRRQLSVTFSRNTTEISSIGSTTGSCYVYNGGTSCTASSNSPRITANTGFVSLGFFTSNTGTMTASSSPKLAASTSYTIQTGATDLANKKIQTGTTVYARGRYPIASEVGYSNSSTGLKSSSGANCTDTQCALDALARMLQ